MVVETELQNGIHIFRLNGEIDLKSSPALREKLQTALKEKPKSLLIDMSNCGYIDSSGIATLVEALQRLKAYGGKLAIACAGQRIKDIFEIAHLDGIFPIFDQLEDARKSLN